MRGLIALVMAMLATAHWLLPTSSLGIDPLLTWPILIELRLPRTLLVLGYGAALGISGAALQAVFANPLASPDISGASSGAALGAVLGMYWLGLTAPLALAASGILGALAALALLFVLAGRRADSATLLLAGIAISLFAGAATSLALALAPSPYAFYDAFDWLMGSFTDRSLDQAAVALIPAAIACAVLLARTSALDRLALGEDVAAALGVRPRRLSHEVVALTAVAVGACVSVCGAVGFVGLAGPVLARGLVRGHPGRAMLPAGLLGAAMLTAADLIVRAIPLARPIPVGVVTAVLGAPLFLWLLVGLRRGIAR